MAGGDIFPAGVLRALKVFGLNFLYSDLVGSGVGTLSLRHVVDGNSVVQVFIDPFESGLDTFRLLLIRLYSKDIILAILNDIISN